MGKLKAVKAISLLWIGSILGAGVAFLIQAILARKLGSESFGLFSSALTTVNLLVPLAGFGVAPFWLKVFGEEGWRAQRWWRGSFQFVVITTLAVLSMLIIWAIWGPHEKQVSILILSLTSYVLGQLSLELVGGKLQLEEKYISLAIWSFIPHLMRLVLVFLLYYFYVYNITVYHISLIYFFVSILFFLLGAFSLFKMVNGSFSLRGHGERTLNMELNEPSLFLVGKGAWPFGLSAALYLIYFQITIVFLNYMVGPKSAGIYNVAFLILSAIYIFPSVVYQKFLLPKLHRWANQDKRRMYDTYINGSRIMFFIGCAIMIAVWLTSSYAISMVFGDQYEESILVLKVLAFAIPIRFLSSSVSSVLTTTKLMYIKVSIMGLGALFTIFFNVTVVPYWGVMGAAITTLSTELLLLICFFFAVKKMLFKNIPSNEDL